MWNYHFVYHHFHLLCYDLTRWNFLDTVLDRSALLFHLPIAYFCDLLWFFAVKGGLYIYIYIYIYIYPGRVAQSVTCLATDACLTADPGVASSIPARSHTFVEIDHEIISTVILLPSADSFKKGCCQLQAKVCTRITG